MICARCRAEAPATATVCGHCGTPFPVRPSPDDGDGGVTLLPSSRPRSSEDGGVTMLPRLDSAPRTTAARHRCRPAARHAEAVTISPAGPTTPPAGAAGADHRPGGRCPACHLRPGHPALAGRQATRGRSRPASPSAPATTSSSCWASAAWAPSTRRGTRNWASIVALKVIRPEAAADDPDCRPRAGTPLQAGTAARPPGHAQERRPDSRPRRVERHQVHHDAIPRGRGPRDDPQARGPPWRDADARHRARHPLRARRRAPGGRRPPRPQAGEHHDRRERRGADHGLRHRPVHRRRVGRAERGVVSRGGRGRRDGRRDERGRDRRDRRVHGAGTGARARRRTSGRTSTRSA